MWPFFQRFSYGWSTNGPSAVTIACNRVLLNFQYEEDYLKNYAETFRSRKNYKLMHDMLTKVQIPLSAMKKFDCRGHWPICSSAIGKIYDQGACWLYWVGWLSKDAFFSHNFLMRSAWNLAAILSSGLLVITMDFSNFFSVIAKHYIINFKIWKFFQFFSLF